MLTPDGAFKDDGQGSPPAGQGQEDIGQEELFQSQRYSDGPTKELTPLPEKGVLAVPVPVGFDHCCGPRTAGCSP